MSRFPQALKRCSTLKPEADDLDIEEYSFTLPLQNYIPEKNG
jgi:hypothetical protein